MVAPSQGVAKLATGIEGFDLITEGGLPKGRFTLLAGTSGSAKTIFSTQFLAGGIQKFDESGVFITFEETPEDIRSNMLSLGWDIAAWEEAGKWAFVDVSPQLDEPRVISGSYDFAGLMERIKFAIGKVKAKRVVVDSLGSIFDQFPDSITVRTELNRFASELRRSHVTALITAERTQEYGQITRLGIGEFVSDNVVILRNVLENEKRRRTVEVLKFRGASHRKGEHPFCVSPQRGVVVIPLAIKLTQSSSTARVSSGISDLDKMIGGGFFQDSIILVSGPAGCGKTLIASQFAWRGVANGERSLILAFEESPTQMFRNASSWGMDFEAMRAQGALKVVAAYPETATLEEHLIMIQNEIAAFRPKRVILESLSALERISNKKSYNQFIIAFASILRRYGVVALVNSASDNLLGGTSVLRTEIFSLSDAIIMLVYVEILGEMRRGINVLKMRGSGHDKFIREYTIDSNGMHIGSPFPNISGILSGACNFMAPDEVERVRSLFKKS